MHVLLVGGGGREHALAWKLSQSPRLTRLSCTHDNPGFPDGAFRPRAAEDTAAWAAAQGVDLVVVGPEGPLAAGLVDDLIRVSVPAFGPTRSGARLESSKRFAKQVMDAAAVPTAAWSAHHHRQAAIDAITGPCVVKADGLAGGKGVVVADSAEQAREVVNEMFYGRFGAAGRQVVIEERLEGPEVSILALCDGTRALPLLPARDHKRRFDGGDGPNTGGMGAICPAPGVDDAMVEEVRQRVLQPVVDAMARSGAPLRGVLYAGVMWTTDGPKVLEFNVRFGDPECQPLLQMLDEDLLELAWACATGSLPDRPLRWRDGASCCVVMASEGYPGDVVTGRAISGVPPEGDDAVVFLAGARAAERGLVTSGGRVLGATCWGPTLEAARTRAYDVVDGISFEGAGWRTDIGGAPR